MTIVRYVPENACSDAGYQAAVVHDDALVVDSMSPDRNVTVHFRLNGRPAEIRFADAARDLVDVATTVYIADEQIARDDTDDSWSRSLEFEVPVRDVSLWREAEDALTSCLSYVSGDTYDFAWRGLQKRLSPYSRHRTRLRGSFDRVCLFSGGVDSLLGAIHFLEAGERVLLVGHQAEGATSSAQRELSRALSARFPDQVAFMQCRVARSRNREPSYPMPRGCEDSHRTRSFLFLNLASAMAHKCGVERIAIPENGLIALNIPLEISRLGSLSTRTAHPLFLSKFCAFANAVGVFDGELVNPFMFKSKTDMLRDSDAWIHPLLKRTVSCARPLRYQDKGVRHCGYCVPCVYRRLAMQEAELDNRAEYAFDVFSGVGALSDALQLDARALVRFAKRVVDASDVQLRAMVFRHGWFDSEVVRLLGAEEDEGVSDLCEMVQRWGIDALGKFQQHSSNATKSILGISRARRR